RDGPARHAAGGDRALGRPSGRPQRARCRAAGARARPGRARRLARRAALLRQHVLGHRAVRARGDAGARPAPRRLRHGVRPGPRDREPAVRGAAVIALAERSRAAELMDDEADLATFAACLRDLERINRWTGAYRITLGWLDRLQRIHGRRLVVLDV